jgi:hypothetical protein
LKNVTQKLIRGSSTTSANNFAVHSGVVENIIIAKKLATNNHIKLP